MQSGFAVVPHSVRGALLVYEFGGGWSIGGSERSNMFLVWCF
jgi:hypothetical protein